MIGRIPLWVAKQHGHSITTMLHQRYQQHLSPLSRRLAIRRTRARRERDPAIKAQWLRDHKLRCDLRVTRLGRFLRQTSLDELPQLWNVMRGDMSLAGPGPVVREELLRYGRNVRAYLAAKPGITGLWQIKGRSETGYRRRVVLDAYYVRNQNLLLDLYILSRTTLVVLGRSGAY